MVERSSSRSEEILPAQRDDWMDMFPLHSDLEQITGSSHEVVPVPGPTSEISRVRTALSAVWGVTKKFLIEPPPRPKEELRVLGRRSR